VTIPDEAQREEVARLAGAEFESKVVSKRLSPLDILEMYPTAALPLGEFLAMLPPMRIRQYSISSSPLAGPGTATLTWTVLDAPSKAAGGKRFLGVASNYLSRVEDSDVVLVSVRACHGNFHPPNDIENTPVIMLCAGSGIAPFRGFVQERAMQISAGRKLAPAYLFVGCAHPDRDQLFKDEFSAWEKEGVVKFYYSYSKAKEQSKGCRYVQERLWEERDEMVEVFNQGAKLYVCGSAMVGEGVAATTKKIYLEAAEALGKDLTDDEVDEWFQRIRNDRYASDIFV
jgi:cytochrome P450 / NADPH-cytochrome P450 reductase